MKCPLREQGKHPEGGDTPHAFADCLKADCAWWDDTLTLCSVRVISQYTIGLMINLHNIAENMPFKAQL